MTNTFHRRAVLAPARVLHLEDSLLDAELLQETLARHWPECEFVRVDERTQFLAHLERGGVDLILSDYSMPAFDGLSALALAQERFPQVPFIFLSGAMGEDVAVEALKKGATDYVIKDRPARLLPAIHRALWEVAERSRRREAEERLRQSEEQFRHIAENVADLIAVLDLQGCWLYNSPSYRAILGPPDLLKGQDSFAQVHPEDSERIRRMFRASIETGVGQRAEFRFLLADATVRFIESQCSLIRNDLGEIIHVLTVSRDITDRKRSEEEVRRLAAIVECSSDAIVAKGLDGRIISWNGGAQRIYGYSPQEALGQPIGFILPPERKAEENVLLERVARGKQIARYESLRLRKGNHLIQVSVSVSPIIDTSGQIVGASEIARDITDRKRAEEEIQRIHAKLEQTNRDLVRRNKEIQNFYHTLSHELKTPLTSAREFISIVMDGLAGPLTETQQEYLGIARDSCNQLRVCINDLLDVTRLETGKLALEVKPASLPALLHRVVTMMGPVAAGKRIQLTDESGPGLPDIPLDSNRITQVITNLLNNALKFTPEGGRIVVRADIDPDRPEFLRVAICDTGRGIPAEELDRIFDRLYQVKLADACTEQGIGLGLYICQELVQLHGGQIHVQSQLNQGTTVSFLLPKFHQARRVQILIVDDDDQMRAGLKQVLEGDEFEAITAAGGDEALQIMREHLPDVVLLDLEMPERDGAQILAEIRKNWEGVPVVLHTGYPDSDLLLRALQSSPFTLLAKPCPASRLIETLRAVRSNRPAESGTRRGPSSGVGPAPARTNSLAA